MLKEIVTFKWKSPLPYRSTFPAKSVNILRNMLERHYPYPHRLTCITDDPNGIDPRVRTLPLWNDFAELVNPNGAHNPNCYRRLPIFGESMRELIGERFAVMDLDTVILGDLSGIFSRTEDFLIWGDTRRDKTWYNGSLFIMTAGARARVLHEFDPLTSPARAYAAGCFGSDQGWISYCLGPNEAKLGLSDGIYSLRVHLREGLKPPPPDARMVCFHGKVDPWNTYAQRLAWIKNNWR